MMKFNGKLSREINKHPFLFLLVLGLVAGAFLGGYLVLSGKGRTGPFQPTATVTATLEATSTRVPEASPTSTPRAPTATVTLVPTVMTGPLVVTFIDVGQGDATLITAPDGQTVLIDGGTAGSGALAYLQGQGIKSVDILIATLPVEDHIGGLAEVLDAMPVKKVITNPQGDKSAIYHHFLDAIATAHAEYVEVVSGDTIELGDLAFSVLNPPASIEADNLITNSLVLRMSHGKTVFLFMGDADKNSEAGILAAGLPVQADILKVGRHGSCSSSSPDFLDAVHPTVAIYSAGLNNSLGNPCGETISALKMRDALILGTDTFGSITVTASMDGYVINNSTGVIFQK